MSEEQVEPQKFTSPPIAPPPPVEPRIAKQYVELVDNLEDQLKAALGGISEQGGDPKLLATARFHLQQMAELARRSLRMRSAG